MNPEQHQKALLSIGYLPFPLTIMMMTHFVALVVGKIYKLRELEAPWIAEYTHLQNKWIIFEGWKWPQTNYYIIGKGIYQRLRFISDIEKIFWLRDFVRNFREMFRNGSKMAVRKISNF